MSNDFINECKNRVNGNRLGKIKIADKSLFQGKNITIENSLGNSDIDLKLYGYTKQDTRSGINPSPDYPSEIEVGTGSVEVKSTGKNLQDVNEGTLSGTNTYYLNSATPLKITSDMVGKYLSWSFDIDIANIATESSMMLYVMGYGTTKGSMEKQIKQVNYPSVTTGKYTCKMEKVLITEDMVDKFITIRYLGLSKPSTFEATYSNAQLEFSETTTNYEPYKESSVQYDLGDNFLAEQDYIENGILNKNVGKIILDGSDDENWTENSNRDSDLTKFFMITISNQSTNYGNGIVPNVKCNYFSCDENMWVIQDNQGLSIQSNNGVLMVRINKSIVSTLNEFKTWLSTHNLEIYYEIKTPTQEQLEITGELKIFEGVTNISNDLNCEMDVEVKIWNKEITNADSLQSIEIDSGCYTDGNIIGSVNAKCLKANFIADNNNLVDKSIQAQIGVKYADLSNEYINMGKYKVERPNNEITANYSQITAYDDLYTNLDTKYVCNIDYFSGNKTVSDLYIDVCNQLGLTPVTTEFINSTIPITSNPFTNSESNRTVLQTVAKIACSFIDIDNDTNQIDLCWLSDSEEPDYIFEYNDGEKALYATAEGGQIVCGPINCLIIKNSQIDDENVTIKDEESIKVNGEHSIVISEDYILYNAELRELAITEIWNRVKGLKYVDCKLTTYYGTPFLKLGSKIRIYTNLTDYFDTYVLKHNFTFDGTFTSIIKSPALTEQEIKTKQNVSLQEALRNTQIEVNKQSGEIKAITQKTTEITDDLNNNYYTKTNINELVQTSETGITNTFSEAGGNNIFRNTSLFASEGTNKYEFWNGNVIRNSNENATSRASMLLQNGALSQEQEVPNGNYSISFYYKKLIELANASVIINDIEYELDSLDVKQFYTGEQDSETKEYITQPINVTNGHIKIVFKCDTNNGVEVYDLMCNKGSVKLAYSQNQNETTTDTVNISKGITITSSVDDIKFKADYDGIRTLDNNGNIKTKFTDKGMETNEAKITEKAEITGLLFQEVDDQSWITKI